MSALPAADVVLPDTIPTTTVLGYIAAVLIIVIAAGAIAIARKQDKGDTGRAGRSATVILIAVGVFALAGGVVGLVAFISSIINDVTG